jgi:hypothetical protein
MGSAYALTRAFAAMAMRRCCWHGGAMLLIFLAAVAIQTAPPQARGAAPPAQPPATMVVEPAAMALATFDADADGRTSRAEMDRGVRRSFEAIDGLRAGTLRYVDFAEWALRWLGDRNALPSPFDVDGNGDDAVSLPELQAWFETAFARLDRNKDGYLTRAELLTIRAQAGDGGRRGKRPER